MSETTSIRVFSVDDHALLREGIAAIITNEPDMVLVAQASTGREAVQQFQQHQPDVTLMDLRLPDMSGIDAMIAIRAGSPDARIIILTTFEGDVEMQRALRGRRPRATCSRACRRGSSSRRFVRCTPAGRAFRPRSRRQLAEHLGDETLTEREIDVLSRVAGGNRNRDIAEQLVISEETVKVHMKHIMEKLGASDRTEAVAIAIRRGIINVVAGEVVPRTW